MTLISQTLRGGPNLGSADQLIVAAGTRNITLGGDLISDTLNVRNGSLTDILTVSGTANVGVKIAPNALYGLSIGGSDNFGLNISGAQSTSARFQNTAASGKALSLTATGGTSQCLAITGTGTGATHHGANIILSGAATVNKGIEIDVTGGATNYALDIMAGDVNMANISSVIFNQGVGQYTIEYDFISLGELAFTRPSAGNIFFGESLTDFVALSNGEIQLASSGEGIYKFNDTDTGNVGNLTHATLTSGQTWTLPDATGTVALTSNITLSGALAGGITSGAFDISMDNTQVIKATNGNSILDLRYSADNTILLDCNGGGFGDAYLYMSPASIDFKNSAGDFKVWTSGVGNTMTIQSTDTTLIQGVTTDLYGSTTLQLREAVKTFTMPAASGQLFASNNGLTLSNGLFLKDSGGDGQIDVRYGNVSGTVGISTDAGVFTTSYLYVDKTSFDIRADDTGGTGFLSTAATLDVTAGTVLTLSGTTVTLDGGSTGGVKVGTASTDKVGFFGATTVVQPAHIADPAAVAALTQDTMTDNSGGTASTTVADITDANNAGSADRIPVEDAFASILAQLAKIKTDVAAVKAGTDANNTAIDLILAWQATLGLTAAS